MSAARPLQGIALLLLAVACFATLDSSVKYLSLGISVLMAIWFRYLFQALAMSAVVLPTRGWRSLQTVHPRLHLLRALLLLSTSLLGFFSVKYMPVGEFTAIIMLTPMVTTLLAATFLKEKVSALRWLLVAGGFCGALLVAQPGGASSGWTLLLPLGWLQAAVPQAGVGYWLTATVLGLQAAAPGDNTAVALARWTTQWRTLID
mgnify:CR=1 FL=1